MLKNKSRRNTLSINVNYPLDSELLLKQNQELLQKSIKLQECLNNYKWNYKTVNDQLFLVNAELQSLKAGAEIFAQQHDALKLNFYCLWYKYYQLQMQHDYLKDKYIEALRKNSRYNAKPNSFQSYASSLNSETRELGSQSSSRAFTPGYNSETRESFNQSSNQGQNITTSNEHPSITERLLRTKQWLGLIR